MKRFYLLVLINLIFINAPAQSFGWANREGRYAYDYGYGVVTDNSGNVYVAGKYEQDADFSGTVVPCSGNHDIFLAKYNSAGALTWVRTGGGLNGDYARGVSTDGANFLYVTGEIEGTDPITFPGSSITLNGDWDNDVFLLKYDLSGTLLWAISEGAWLSEKAHAVANDNSGNVFITGYFTDTTNFNGVLIPGAGGRDMFVAKYDANGNYQWMKKAGSTGRDEGLGVKCDASGNVYVCGTYRNGANFDGTILTVPLTGTGYHVGAYLAKYSPSGTLLWVKSFGGDYDDVAWALTIDNAGTIYVAGEFVGYATYDAHALVTSGGGDIFVAAFDPSGNVQWASKAGGPLDDRVRGIGTDGTKLFLTGQYGATAMFGTTALTAADSSDVFIAAMYNTGAFNWALAVGGIADSVETLGFESGLAVTGLSSGEVYVTGSLLDGGTFGSTSYVKYSRTDVFVAKILQVGTSAELVHTKGDLLTYPNPTNGLLSLDVSKITGQKVGMNVMNSLGQSVTRENFVADAMINVDLSGQEKGIYFIEITTDQSVFREKIILQ